MRGLRCFDRQSNSPRKESRLDPTCKTMTAQFFVAASSGPPASFLALATKSLADAAARETDIELIDDAPQREDCAVTSPAFFESSHPLRPFSFVSAGGLAGPPRRGGVIGTPLAALSHSGRLLATTSCAVACEVMITDMARNASMMCCREIHPISALVFSPNDQFLLVSSRCCVSMYDVSAAPGEAPRIFHVAGGSENGVFSPCGMYFAFTLNNVLQIRSVYATSDAAPVAATCEIPSRSNGAESGARPSPFSISQIAWSSRTSRLVLLSLYPSLAVIAFDFFPCAERGEHGTTHTLECVGLWNDPLSCQVMSTSSNTCATAISNGVVAVPFRYGGGAHQYGRRHPLIVRAIDTDSGARCAEVEAPMASHEFHCLRIDAAESGGIVVVCAAPFDVSGATRGVRLCFVPMQPFAGGGRGGVAMEQLARRNIEALSNIVPATRCSWLHRQLGGGPFADSARLVVAVSRRVTDAPLVLLVSSSGHRVVGSKHPAAQYAYCEYDRNEGDRSRAPIKYVPSAAAMPEDAVIASVGLEAFSSQDEDDDEMTLLRVRLASAFGDEIAEEDRTVIKLPRLA
jgi:hypothetical protein